MTQVRHAAGTLMMSHATRDERLAMRSVRCATCCQRRGSRTDGLCWFIKKDYSCQERENSWPGQRPLPSTTAAAVVAAAAALLLVPSRQCKQLIRGHVAPLHGADTSVP